MAPLLFPLVLTRWRTHPGFCAVRIMRLSLAIGIITSILRIRGAPSNAARSLHLAEYLITGNELDFDRSGAQEVLSPLQLAGEPSAQEGGEASFDLLEAGTELTVGSVEKHGVGWYDPRLRGGRMLDVRAKFFRRLNN